MAGAKRVTYSFTFDGTNYGIKLPENYYNSIDTKLGITKTSDTNRPKFTMSRRQAVSSGALMQIGILYRKNNRLTRSIVLCSPSKYPGVLAQLEGDTYRSFPITSAYIPQRRRVV